MEEFVGKIWDRFITNRANISYPEAAVELEDVRKGMGIFFRALGGEAGLRVESTTESDNHARRSLLQRIAGIGDKVQYAYRDDETLRLPDSIAYFNDKQLNQDLYLWLTALSVVETKGKTWLERNQYRTHQIIQIWPGLQGIYAKLLKAHLALRPDPSRLPKLEQDQETLIQLALQDSTKSITLNYANRTPQPVILWLHPSPPNTEFQNKYGHDIDISDDEDDQDSQNNKTQNVNKRKKAELTDLPDGNSGLMSFRLESLFSWSEMSKVDRTTTDDDDDDGAKTAEDMDKISIARDQQTTASKIKLNLDLPATEYDDITLTDGIALDEWDYKKQIMQKAHCRLQVMQQREPGSTELPIELLAQARKVRRQFELLRPERHWLGRQTDGTEMDLENYIGFLTDKTRGVVSTESPFYRQLKNTNRDLSCLLLADLSLSTDAYVNDEKRVIDVIRHSLLLFSEALHTTGDKFALHGFSSCNRNHVRFYNIKTFNNNYSKDIVANINALKPGFYTRMGAGIRHASEILSKQNTAQKLLLILTDGKPNDIDKYEGRYGIEDTRMAVLEAEKLGLRPFCITIDQEAEDYLPYLFGKGSFTVVKDASQLPSKLPQLYLRLTT